MKRKMLNNLLLITVIVIVASGFVGCSGAGQVMDGPDMVRKAEYTQIDQNTAKEMMAQDDGHIVVDVRRQDEYDSGHIPGAICIPNESIGEQPPAELADLEQMILVYCRSGRRSKEAAQKLADIGYTNVYEFGGIIDWSGETVVGNDNTENTEADVENNTENTEADPEENITIETVTTNGFSMNYFKFGHGDKTYVILPGLSAQGVMGSAAQIAAGYQAMTEEFTIYVFDPRNELPASYDIVQMSEDTAAVFKALGLERVYVMGASMGGMVAMEMAVHHPELIEKMVLASTALQMKEEQFQTLENWIRLAQEKDAQALYLNFGEAIYPQEIFEQSRDALIEASKTVTEEDLERFIILAESMRGFDIIDDLDKIECPMLAVNDTDDHVLGAEAVQTIGKYMEQRQNCEYYLYKGYGHALYDLAPDFKERMLAFFL